MAAAFVARLMRQLVYVTPMKNIEKETMLQGY